jgi:ABC-type Fe3+-hydroxamate transport system substrate-binding protein
MRRIFCLLLTFLILTGCTASPAGTAAITFTDDLGYSVCLESWDRVVSLYGSFGETWLLAGGTLIGTTRDALSERALPLGEDVALVGSVKEPNLEQIIALNPDFVILSADTANQVKLHDALTQAGIPHYAGADSFVTSGAFATCGVNYTELGIKTAKMALEILTSGTMPAHHVMEGGIITVNTQTAAALKLDYSVFAAGTNTIKEVVTQ